VSCRSPAQDTARHHACCLHRVVPLHGVVPHSMHSMLQVTWQVQLAAHTHRCTFACIYVISSSLPPDTMPAVEPALLCSRKLCLRRWQTEFVCQAVSHCQIMMPCACMGLGCGIAVATLDEKVTRLIDSFLSTGW
jgi:hypothetical protein